MGDMAEYLSDSHWPWDGDEYDDAPYEPPIPKTNLVCKYCGAGHLRWQHTGKGYRLATRAGEIHSCADYRKAMAETNRRLPQDTRTEKEIFRDFYENGFQ